MPSWTDYTKKQQPSDNDLMMIEDVDANVNKRLEFSGLADWIVEKLKKNNVISGALKFKGSSAYASLPTNPEVNDYYYSPDGNGTDGAGYYAWNGTAWIFIGNNDKGVDSTFTVEGAAADSKAVGDKFAKVDSETASLKEDIGNISSSKISKFYATNNGENHLADSDNGKIADMMVYGRSERKSTTGAQLFDMSTAFSGWVGNDGTPKNNGAIGKADNIVSDYITVDGNTAYSCDGNNIFVWTYDSSKVLIKSYGQLNSKSFTTSETAKYVVLAFSCQRANAPDRAKIIMFNKGSAVLPWEPYTGGKPSPSPDYPQEIKGVVNPTVKVTNKDGLKIQSVTLNNIALNAIPVSSGGNVTIDGQQYIADYVDVERGKLVRMCKEVEYNGDESWELQSVNANNIANFKLKGVMALESKGLSNKLLLQKTLIANTNSEGFYINNIFQLFIRISKNRNISTVAEFKNFLSKNPIRVLLAFTTPEEIDLTPEEIAAFKALATYYPVTNISVNSEQLDGYTVFNYPISMENGWNYVKQQLNDNRDYIYDMDLQSAEAYVNSEYAVALTELEV